MKQLKRTRSWNFFFPFFFFSCGDIILLFFYTNSVGRRCGCRPGRSHSRDMLFGEQIRQENQPALLILLGATRKKNPKNSKTKKKNPASRCGDWGCDACRGEGHATKTCARCVLLSKEVNPGGFAKLRGKRFQKKKRKREEKIKRGKNKKGKKIKILKRENFKILKRKNQNFEKRK